MTKIDIGEDETIRTCGKDESHSNVTLYQGKETTLGTKTKIRRLMPTRQRRMVGPWCFLDHFGPVSFEDRQTAMWVGPHPHIGLQTVTWLLEGEVLHRDSIGSVQEIRPGQLNVMTSGRGISHSEETPKDNSGHMHGLQFWVALPEDARNVEPTFEHAPAVPAVERRGVTIRVFAGDAFGQSSPAHYYSPIVGFDMEFGAGGTEEIELDREFEHALVVTRGRVVIDGEDVTPGTLAYLGTGRDSFVVEHDADTHAVVLGGEPFGEEIYMWWNFVGRSADEIATARQDWESGRRFGDVDGFDGARIAAPKFLGKR